jgi:hypothetical protein
MSKVALSTEGVKKFLHGKAEEGSGTAFTLEKAIVNSKANPLT